MLKLAGDLNVMKFNAYGNKIEVVKSSDNWVIFYLGNEGKKRTAHDILIPPEVKEEEIKNYLEDLLHEWARPGNNTIEQIDAN